MFQKIIYILLELYPYNNPRFFNQSKYAWSEPTLIEHVGKKHYDLFGLFEFEILRSDYVDFFFGQ